MLGCRVRIPLFLSLYFNFADGADASSCYLLQRARCILQVDSGTTFQTQTGRDREMGIDGQCEEIRDKYYV